MRLLLKNLDIIPMTDYGYHFLGDIGIEDGRIVFTGSDPSFMPDEVKDCGGMTAIPAFVNAHTHLAMTLMRNYKDTSPNLQAWLSEIFPIEDKLNDEAVYSASLIGLAELIKCGCTTFADMYFHQKETIKVTREAGLRGIIGLTFFGDIKEARETFNTEAPVLEAMISGDGMFRLDAAVHSIYTCTADTYRFAADWVRESGACINTHLSETEKEVSDCIAEHGLLPAQYLERNGAFDVPCYVAHGVHLKDAELPILKEHGISIVHNPSSNCKLASGIAPVAHYRDNGINIALGTDGAASNNSLNMIKEMNLAAMLSTVSTGNPVALKPYDLLRMATIGGAEALHLADRIGTIEAGKDADIVLFNTAGASMSPVNDIFSALVYSSDRADVDTVFCRGRKLLEKGRLLTLDEEAIVKEHRRCWNELIRG